jgi:hypothetical protein
MNVKISPVAISVRTNYTVRRKYRLSFIVSYLEYIREQIAVPPPRKVDFVTVAKMLVRQTHIRIFLVMGILFFGVSIVVFPTEDFSLEAESTVIFGMAFLGSALIVLPFYFMLRDVRFLRRGVLTQVRFLSPLPSKENWVEVEYFVFERRFVRRMVYDPSFYKRRSAEESDPVLVIALPESGSILTFLQLSECTR